MAGSITVKYAVIDEIVADINRLADRADKHAKKKTVIHRSKGKTAKSVQACTELVAQYASVLAKVMRITATRITVAKTEMIKADVALSQQLSGSGGEGEG